jgi:hypothetical protein
MIARVKDIPKLRYQGSDNGTLILISGFWVKGKHG